LRRSGEKTMITSEIREELKRIQAELKKPFRANQHRVRDLPGSNFKWVFLPHQVIRERLDEVIPDWIVDYSDLQYIGNDCICRCGITILGVRKEAIASVPVSLVSSKGNEMTRGSAPDRLMAEATKNAAEQWGTGRYLDDQEFTIRYLWEHLGELDEQMQGEVRRLSEQYKIQVGGRQPQVKPKNETGLIYAVAGTSAESLITEGQRKRLWAIAKNELKLSDEQIKGALKHFGFERAESITRDQYESLIEYLKHCVKAPTQPDLYPANNDIVKRIRGLTKHEPRWILAQCKHYGCDRPGMMPPAELEKLIMDMCADWAVGTKVIGDHEKAHTSIQGALAFAAASGRPILGAAIEWLNRHQLEVST